MLKSQASKNMNSAAAVSETLADLLLLDKWSCGFDPALLMDVCPRFSLCLFSFVDTVFEMGRSPIQVVVPTV
jgi:hypothetical protein